MFRLPLTNMASSVLFLLVAFLCTNSISAVVPAGQFNDIDSFQIPRSPSGMFFDDAAESNLLWVLCGTSTNRDHYLYAFSTDGQEQCFITIPQSAGMTRVDGFYISQDNKAYIVDSQGPIYADQGDEYLGGSVYQVEWTTNTPCDCVDGVCSLSEVTWSPAITDQWSLLAEDVSATEGGGNDEYFRNSGIVVVDDSWYAVNGVHPIDGSLSMSYDKSLVKVSMDTGDVIDSWAFDASTLGHDVDMEALTCGPDNCVDYLYIGDEYNYIYKFDLSSGTVIEEWDINTIVGEIPADKGIESLAYASSTGYFYAGIQQTGRIHVVDLMLDTSTTGTGDDGSLTAENGDNANGDDYGFPTIETSDDANADPEIGDFGEPTFETSDDANASALNGSSSANVVAICASVCMTTLAGVLGILFT